MKKLDNSILRIMDANINRALEGLRVVEEVGRFILNDGQIAEELKDIRHSVVGTVKTCVLDYCELLKARDSNGDVGANIHNDEEIKRADIEGILIANMKRVQEALRVLEEFSKIINPDLAISFKSKRYQLYDMEKSIINRLRSVLND